jgi:hypothetical protein
MPSGGGYLSNVFVFGIDPSQPQGDYDLYLKVNASPDYEGFANCFANFVPPLQAAVLGAVQRSSPCLRRRVNHGDRLRA